MLKNQENRIIMTQNQKGKRLKNWSECYEINVYSRRQQHSVFQTSVTTIFVEILCAFLFFCDHFSHSVLLSFLSQRCDHVFNQCGWFLEWNVGKNANQCGEDFCYESLVYCQDHTDLVFDEYRMEPTRQEKRPRNTGLDPISMKTNQWCGTVNQTVKATILRFLRSSIWMKNPLE